MPHVFLYMGTICVGLAPIAHPVSGIRGQNVTFAVCGNKPCPISLVIESALPTWNVPFTTLKTGWPSAEEMVVWKLSLGMFPSISFNCNLCKTKPLAVRKLSRTQTERACLDLRILCVAELELRQSPSFFFFFDEVWHMLTVTCVCVCLLMCLSSSWM